MSTLKEFENAPVGATASLNGSVRVWKETVTSRYGWWNLSSCEWLSHEELVEKGFTLDPAPEA